MTDGVTGGTKYASRPTLDEAARQIGKSVRTLERMAKAGTLRTQLWRPNPSAPFRRVCHPADVATLAGPVRLGKGPGGPAAGPVVGDPAADGAPGADGAPDAADGLLGGSGGGSAALDRRPDGRPVAIVALVRELLGIVVTECRAVAAAPAPGPADPDPRWLTLKEAAAETGRSVHALARKIREGSLHGERDRGVWMVRKRDLRF